jgi:hypothetical protein
VYAAFRAGFTTVNPSAFLFFVCEYKELASSKCVIEEVVFFYVLYKVNINRRIIQKRAIVQCAAVE